MTGKEERLPLRLMGTGLGPSVALNIEYLNINEVFVNLVHYYEVVAYNKGSKYLTLHFTINFLYVGPIPAQVCFVRPPKVPQPHRKIRCNPTRQILQPEECKVFILEFYGSREGEFVEEVKFSVKNSDEFLKILMTYVFFLHLMLLIIWLVL